jgi:transposase InsO family protein
MSDNGACYRSRAHAEARRQLGIGRHLFTRPYRPRTNGKACVLAWGCRPVGRRGCPLPVV